MGIEELVGKTLKYAANNGDEFVFETVEGKRYALYHEQDCCENVRVEEVIGDIEDIILSTILDAKEVKGDHGDDSSGSYTWTFYDIRTRKGSVTIRWLGESNGYYSESVDWDSDSCTGYYGSNWCKMTNKI